MSYVEVDLEPIMLSPSRLAWLMDAGEEEGVWIPVSSFETPPDKEDIGKSMTFEITERMARDKGLI